MGWCTGWWFGCIKIASFANSIHTCLATDRLISHKQEEIMTLFFWCWSRIGVKLIFISTLWILLCVIIIGVCWPTLSGLNLIFHSMYSEMQNLEKSFYQKRKQLSLKTDRDLLKFITAIRTYFLSSLDCCWLQLGNL